MPTLRKRDSGEERLQPARATARVVTGLPADVRQSGSSPGGAGQAGGGAGVQIFDSRKAAAIALENVNRPQDYHLRCALDETLKTLEKGK